MPRVAKREQPGTSRNHDIGRATEDDVHFRAVKREHVHRSRAYSKHGEHDDKSPQQGTADRRVLRSRYSDMKNRIVVQKPREQVAAAEALMDIANLVTSVKSQNNGLTPSDFVNCLLKHFGSVAGSSSNRPENGDNSLYWKDVGISVSHIFRKVHGCSTMLGPMDTEMNQRKVMASRKRTKPTESSRPEEYLDMPEIVRLSRSTLARPEVDPSVPDERIEMVGLTSQIPEESQRTESIVHGQITDCDGSCPPKPKIVIGFDMSGLIIQNKNELQKATRGLLHSQFSVGVDSWNEVNEDMRTDIWNTLKCDFEMDDIHKTTVMTMMGNQLKNYRNRIRSRELKDLSTSEILKRLNDPPADIQLTTWNKFITREATEAKMRERLKNVENRAHNEDVHCLGKKSYAQVSAELTAKGIDHDRLYLYKFARTQPDGSITPAAAENVKNLEELQHTLDPVDRHNIRRDALTRLKGPDQKGRIRGVSSRMSKLKYVGMQTVKAFIQKKTAEFEDATAAFRHENDERFNEIMSRLDRIESRSSTSSSTPTFQSSPSILISNPSPSIQVPGPSSNNVPNSPSTCIYRIFSTVSYDCIAFGSASLTQLVGENVHGFRLQDNETKINVTMVTPGREDDPLYKGSQVGGSTIGEIVGNYIIWPTLLLKPI